MFIDVETKIRYVRVSIIEPVYAGMSYTPEYAKGG